MQSSTGKVTLKDVAARTGVSAAAVSLALRGRSGVSAGTRSRIAAVAEEMGYHAIGRGSGRETAGTVGVVLRDIVSVFSHDVVSGMESATADPNLRLIFFDGRGDQEHIRAEFDKLKDQKLKGIVNFGAAIHPRMLQKVAQRTPVVIIGKTEIVVPGVDVVSNDDVLGARLAVKHLIELGHTHIAHLCKGSLRVDGYLQQMAEAGLQLHTQIEGGALDTVRPGIRYLVLSILQEKDAATAVFAETDGIAIDFIGAAVDAGLQVPDDVSVVGYDSTRQCEMIRPRLSSVGQPRHQMGIAAMRLLQERWDGRTEDRHVILKPELDLRESTYAPVRPVRW
ncbi:LacI family DNA-binding transcriptional regulator [Actinopolymorpha pittospori]|uniref:DNA-binding LacI/PurR family transcriptional regulator n=1 Tax=Actinopolymorpha pittospori TaxID=648752 RepID=A0A927MPE4_9ACTN|nr:LacI family DNA-binding transcriptional regulator [Actinopolymorpha pittospori]MBE1603644.1 DNA-binding LacI/PurR family transcriptional regulator [Actinopolymorpha pittospori]